MHGSTSLARGAARSLRPYIAVSPQTHCNQSTYLIVFECNTVDDMDTEVIIKPGCKSHDIRVKFLFQNCISYWLLYH